MKYYRRKTISTLNTESYDILNDHLVVNFNDENYDLGITDYETIFRDSKSSGKTIDEYVKKIISDTNIPTWKWNNKLGPIDDSLLLPLFPQEVWAAGVTYSDSMRERQAESDTPDVYAKVYSSKRPEIFFKGTAERMQGPNEYVGIRKDSGWDVPESELAVVIIDGEIAGYTIGNDMSSRSIEGENPLYLPQAKVYNMSCSLGPCIVSVETIGDPQKLSVNLEIIRNNKIVFKGESSTSKMKRNVKELTEWLQKSNDLPGTGLLLTGTGIIPEQDFTLKPEDLINISIEKIGTLTNKVALV